ncbi:hypothetical protein PoB_003859300 [Plakobranchus ocellatus]|uniref:Uncharacterized protein n=1 Tax=Plakobranchus ocellatus TaxID=259542 RepID=A0AAV4B009_9GAST|nr:hypothetical protein PoB_003859300 [Plakobranchus ocellatus]
MFPWDDRGDGHPSDTTLLNTLAPVLVAHRLLTHGPPSGRGAGGGARSRDRMVPADLRTDSQASVPPTPPLLFSI